jgi:hypothetical protein
MLFVEWTPNTKGRLGRTSWAFLSVMPLVDWPAPLGAEDDDAEAR